MRLVGGRSGDMVLAFAFVRLNRPCTRDSFRTSLFALRACIKTAVFTSDKKVLCKLPGVISLDFFDTLDPCPKTPGNRPQQAGQLAVPAFAGEPRPCRRTLPGAKVYPRVYGGTGDRRHQRRSGERSIPACVGKVGKGCGLVE